MAKEPKVVELPPITPSILPIEPKFPRALEPRSPSSIFPCSHQTLMTRRSIGNSLMAWALGRFASRTGLNRTSEGVVVVVKLKPNGLKRN